MNSNVVGFDPSLTSSGFAYTDSTGEVHTGRIRPKTRGAPRLDFVAESFESILNTMVIYYKAPPLVVYEGYAMGIPKKRGGGVGRFFDIGELGLLKLIAYRRGVDVLLVPPHSLKKFATGKGNSTKDDVIKSIMDVWGYNIPHNDEADAFALMQMGIAYIDCRKARKKYRIDALNGCSMQLCK